MPLAHLIIGFGIFLIAFLRALQRSETQANMIVRRVFYGYSLGFIGELTIGAQFTTYHVRWWVPVLFLTIGFVSGWIGTKRNGLQSWIDVTAFVSVYFILYLTDPLSADGHRLPFIFEKMMSLPVGAIIGTFSATVQRLRE